MDFSQRFVLLVVVLVTLSWDLSVCQQKGSFNFARKTAGEREGDLSPSAIAGVSLGVVAGLGALGVTVFFCYYVYRQQRQDDSINSSFEVRKY